MTTDSMQDDAHELCDDECCEESPACIVCGKDDRVASYWYLGESGVDLCESCCKVWMNAEAGEIQRIIDIEVQRIEHPAMLCGRIMLALQGAGTLRITDSRVLEIAGERYRNKIENLNRPIRKPK